MTLQTWIFFLGPLSSLLSSVLPLKLKTDIDRYLRALFALMLVVEIAGYVVPRIWGFSNNWIYNSYTLLQFILYFLVFYTLTKSARWKKIIQVMTFLLILVFIWENFIVFDFFKSIQFKTYIAGCACTTILAIRYLMFFIQTDEIYDFYRSRSFWFCCGVLVFSIPFIPIMISFEYLLIDNRILSVLTPLLVIFMHICFVISFQWTIRR